MCSFLRKVSLILPLNRETIAADDDEDEEDDDDDAYVVELPPIPPHLVHNDKVIKNTAVHIHNNATFKFIRIISRNSGGPYNNQNI